MTPLFFITFIALLVLVLPIALLIGGWIIFVRFFEWGDRATDRRRFGVRHPRAAWLLRIAGRRAGGSGQNISSKTRSCVGNGPTMPD